MSQGHLIENHFDKEVKNMRHSNPRVSNISGQVLNTNADLTINEDDDNRKEISIQNIETSRVLNKNNKGGKPAHLNFKINVHSKKDVIRSPPAKA